MEQTANRENLQELIYNQYGVIWLFYCQKPIQDKDNFRIVSIYKELDIRLPIGVLSKSDQIQNAFQHPQIEKTGYIKLAVIGQMQSNNSRIMITEIRQHKQFVIIKYGQSELQSVLDHSFSEMKELTFQLTLESIFHSINQKQQQDLFLKLITLYACSTDEFCDRQSFLKPYKKIFGEVIIPKNSSIIMQNYLTNQTFRSYLQTKMSKINDEDKAVEIGYLLRKLSLFIKKNSFKVCLENGGFQTKQYKKYIRWNEQYLKYLKEGSIYCMSSIQKFTKSQYFQAQQLQQIPTNRKSAFAVIIINTEYQGVNKLNNGIYQTDKQGIFNCLNYFQFIQATCKKGYNQAVDIVYYQFQFRMISEKYWNENLCKIDSNDPFLGKQIDFLLEIFEFLEQKKNNITLEDIFLHSKNFRKTQIILTKRLQKKMNVNSQYCEKIGVLPAQLSNETRYQVSTIDQAARSYKIAKGFYKYNYLVIVLKKQIQLLSKKTNNTSFNKDFIQLNQKRLQLSIINNQMPRFQQQSQSCRLLKQIYRDIKQLAGLLSYTNIHKISPVEEPQRGCLSCIFKEIPPSQEELRTKNQQILQQYMFKEVQNQALRSNKLIELKQQLVRLHSEFQKAILSINRFGNGSAEFISFSNNFNADKQLNSDIQKLKAINKKRKDDFFDEDFSIQSFLSKKESDISTLQSDFYNYSQNLRSSQKIHRADSLSNSVQSLRESRSSLEQSKKKNKKILIQLENKLQDMENIYSEQNSKQYKQTCKLYAKSLIISIQVLKQQNYSVNSLKMMKLYRKLAKVYIKISNLVQLKKLTQIQFLEQQHSFTLKAQLYSDLAHLAYRRRDFQLCLGQIRMGCELLSSLTQKTVQDKNLIRSINNKKIIDLKILQFKVLYYQLRNLTLRLKSQKIQYLLKQIDKFTKIQQQKIGIRFMVYRIELNLLQSMIGQIQIQLMEKNKQINSYGHSQQNRAMEMRCESIAKSMKLMKDISKIYGVSIKYALILIDILIKRHNMRHASSGNYSIQNLQVFVQQIFNNIEQIFEKKYTQGEQKVKYSWILWLSRFFKERQNNKKLFQISQSLRLIEGCLHEFKKIKLMDRMDTDLEGYYQTIYSLYLKFMRKYLKKFPTRENILLSNEENDDSAEIEKKASSANLKKTFFNYEIVWLFCINSSRKQWSPDRLLTLRSKQGQRMLRENKIHCISNNVQQFYEGIVRLRTQGKYIIKGAIESKLLQHYLQKGGDLLFSKLKQLDKIAIIIDVEDVSQQLIIKNLKGKLKQKLEIFEQRESKIKQLLQQFENNMDFQYDTKRNTIFFQKQYYRKKIINYHTIIHACISHAVNQQLLKRQTSLEDYKKIANQFMKKNNRVQHLSGTYGNTINQLFRSRKPFYECFQKLTTARSESQIQEIRQQLITYSNKIINTYRVENIFYHLTNSNQRVLYECPERIEWQFLQPDVYMLYHSILTISNKQRKLGCNSQLKSLKLWRIVEMKQEEYQSYMEIYSQKNPYIKYMSFLSTSSSFKWIQQELQRRIKDNLRLIKKYAIIQIELTIDNIKQDQIIDNGFVTQFNQSESETLFNILNVFQVEQVSKVVIDQIAPEFVPVIEKFKRKEIIYIKQKFVNSLSQFSQNDIISPPIQYFFNFQSQFNKQRSHYQKYRQSNSLRQFRISSYSLIEAYMDLGELQKAEELIKFQFQRAHNSPLDFMQTIFRNDQNLLHKLISIYMKKGDHRAAQKLFTDYDRQLKEIKKSIQQQADKRLLAQKSYQMKKEMIQIFQQQVNIQQYQNRILDIQKEINRLDESTDENKIKKAQQIIYLHLHRSIYHFQRNKIEDSLKFFNETLKKIKEICVPSAFFDKIKKYCENIIKSLRKLFSRYQILNKNHFKIDDIAASFIEAIQIVNHKQNKQYSDIQVNLYCCQTVAETLKSQQNLSQSQISNITQNIEIESQASDNIDEEISLNPSLQHYKDNIKTINFCLLGKVQTQKERVAKCSLTNMEKYLSKFQKVSQKLNSYQIQDLKSRGFQQQSIELIRIRRKKAKSALSKMNAEQFQNHIQAIFIYCRQRSSHQLEQCRALILRVQFEQIKLKNKLMAHNYKMEEQDKQYFQKIHKDLNYADAKLKQVCSKGQNHNFFHSMIQDTEQIKLKSPQNLAITMLRVKIAYQEYFQTKNDNSDLAKNRKELLHKALDQLEMAIASREKSFTVLNEEIYLYNIRSQFSILIIKNPEQFYDYFSKFKLGIVKRKDSRGANSLQNAIDCIELLEIFDIFQDQSIMSKVSKDDRDKLYLYVKEGARSSENNSLFWRFIRCMFTRILRKSYKTNKEYAIAKLEFILRALKQIKRLQVIDELSIGKMKQTYEKFIKYSKQIRQVESIDQVRIKKQQILDIINEIENRNKRIQQEPQNNFDGFQLQQQSKIQNSKHKNKIAPYPTIRHQSPANQRQQKLQASNLRQSNQQLPSFNCSPQTRRYIPITDRDISMDAQQFE